MLRRGLFEIERERYHLGVTRRDAVGIDALRGVGQFVGVAFVDGVHQAVAELQLGDEVPFHPGVRVSLDFHTTPHLLRHTYVSELILSGVAVKRVQYLAGHSSPVQTLKIYTHLMENRPEDLYSEVLKAFSE